MSLNLSTSATWNGSNASVSWDLSSDSNPSQVTSWGFVKILRSGDDPSWDSILNAVTSPFAFGWQQPVIPSTGTVTLPNEYTITDSFGNKIQIPIGAGSSYNIKVQITTTDGDYIESNITLDLTASAAPLTVNGITTKPKVRGKRK